MIQHAGNVIRISGQGGTGMSKHFIDKQRLGAKPEARMVFPPFTPVVRGIVFIIAAGYIVWFILDMLPATPENLDLVLGTVPLNFWSLAMTGIALLRRAGIGRSSCGRATANTFIRSGHIPPL